MLPFRNCGDLGPRISENIREYPRISENIREYRDICSLPPGPRTLLLLYFKREGAGKMCFIVKFVDSQVFLLELCELKLRQCVMSCLSWWRHLKSLCSNLSIYMFDLVGVKRQWLLCILWLLRGMQIDDIS